MRRAQVTVIRRPRLLAAATLLTLSAVIGFAAVNPVRSQPMMGGMPMMMDQEMMHLGDQLRDCRGDACVPIRDHMMSRLREQMDNCSGSQCEELRDRLQMHERVQSCHMDQRGCRELRMQERDMVRPHHSYGTRSGMHGGQGMQRGPMMQNGDRGDQGIPGGSSGN